jgi:hypothetical protein
VFVDGIRYQGTKQQLLLESQRTVNETVRQTLELEFVKLAARSSIRLWKAGDRALWQSQPPPKQKKRLLTSYVLVL